MNSCWSPKSRVRHPRRPIRTPPSRHTFQSKLIDATERELSLSSSSTPSSHPPCYHSLRRVTLQTSQLPCQSRCHITPSGRLDHVWFVRHDRGFVTAPQINNSSRLFANPRLPLPETQEKAQGRKTVGPTWKPAPLSSLVATSPAEIRHITLSALSDGATKQGWRCLPIIGRNLSSR